MLTDDEIAARIRAGTRCLLHPPPREGSTPARADHGYTTCAPCADKLRRTLTEIRDRYWKLDPTPGGSSEQARSAPGFGSRSPASEHIITMTDWRSKPCETGWDAVTYVWDPLADTTLEPGQHGPPAGAYVEKREVWYGADGRPHAEQERPPRSIPLVLAGLADMVAEDRDVAPPTTRDVPELARWLDQHLDYITRQDWVVDVAADLHQLVGQLRPATGVPGPRPIGKCPNTIDEGETTRQCSTPLFAPLTSDTIRCSNPVCQRKWERPEWEQLGKLLQEETLLAS